MTTAEGQSLSPRRSAFVPVMRDARQGASAALVAVALGIAAQFIAPVLLQGDGWQPFEVQAQVGVVALLIAFSFLCDGLRAEKRRSHL